MRPVPGQGAARQGAAARSQSGLGTLEVAIALVILAFLTVALLATIGASWAGVIEQGHRQLAVGCAAQVLEQYRAALLAGDVMALEGACPAAPPRGLWYRLQVRPDEGTAPEGGGNGSPGSGGGGGIPAGPVRVAVAVYPGSPGTPAAAVYTVSTVFWPLAGDQSIPPAGPGS